MVVLDTQFSADIVSMVIDGFARFKHRIDGENTPDPIFTGRFQ